MFVVKRNVSLSDDCCRVASLVAMALVIDPLLSTVTLNVRKGKLRVESPEARIRQVTKYRLS